MRSLQEILQHLIVDINLKKSIVKIKDPLEKLDKLNGYTFEME